MQNHYNPHNLKALFEIADKNKDGEIDASDLQSSLSNGTWLPFNPVVAQIMIKMFDVRCIGKINLEEFGRLWKYVTEWQNCFQKFDKDNSNSLDFQEFQVALQTFGYKLSPDIASKLIAKFDRQRKGTLAFDDFIHCCIRLNNSTNDYRQLDTDGDGIAKINYEKFLGIVIDLLIQ